MYNHHFGFSEAPFSIAPDPRYLYLSEQHREALGHLVYGIGDHGGFVVLTGEVGTGKTTVCRCLLQQIPEHIDIAVIVNPKLDSHELLQTICDELGVALAEENPSAKQLLDALNAFLLATHARGRNAILIVDEAQNLAPDVLEQLRLLTNLETNERKLLQLILLGQPELNTLLARPSLRQLSQRITARYHLRPLARDEVTSYIEHRVAIAGGRGPLFTRAAIARIYAYSKGIPRLINLLCDRALLGVYSESGSVVSSAMVRRAAAEIMPRFAMSFRAGAYAKYAVAALAVIAVALAFYVGWQEWDRWSDAAAPVATRATSWQHVLQTTDAGQSDAISELARIWGVATPPERCPQSSAEVSSSVEVKTDAELSCVPLGGLSATDIKGFNVPVVLPLVHGALPPRYVVLKQMRGAQAQIGFGGRDWEVAWEDVAALWRGEVLLLAPAPVAKLPLQPGADDALIAWFDTHLYRHFHRNERRWQREIHDGSSQLKDGAPKTAFLASHYLALREQPPTSLYGAELLAEVKRFQLEQGMQGSGVIDLPTVVALSRVRGKDMLLLRTQTPEQDG